MDTLARLQSRISSLAELRSLFGAMRALAASHVQAAQGALGGIRKYAEVVEDSISQVGSLITERPRGPAEDLGPSVQTVLVVCSEHGFTGGFNARLMDRARLEGAAGRNLAVIGRRGALMASEAGLEPASRFAMPTHVGGVLGVARSVAAGLAGSTDIRVVFARYLRGGQSEVAVRQIIPIDPARIRRSDSFLPPLHHLAPEVLLQRLVAEYLFAEITLAITESLASENGARLQIMEAADRTISDKLDGLRRRERSLRQEAITAELLDVVTGAEAILGRA